jgi:hypothetical protein
MDDTVMITDETEAAQAVVDQALKKDIYEAVISNSAEIVDDLLETFFELDSEYGPKKTTLLIEAVSRFPLDNMIALLLLDAGASGITKNIDGDTALGIAASWGNLELVQAMMTGGHVTAENMPKNSSGYTPYKQAQIMRRMYTDTNMKVVKNPEKAARLYTIMSILHAIDPEPTPGLVDGSVTLPTVTDTELAARNASTVSRMMDSISRPDSQNDGS